MADIKSEQDVMSFRNESGPPTKRKRTVTSCAQCRKKKVKCDRSRPRCKVCVMANKGDQCEYQEPSWNEHVKSVSNDYTVAANVPMAHININSNNNGTIRRATAESLSPIIQNQRSSAEAVFVVNQPSVHPSVTPSAGVGATGNHRNSHQTKPGSTSTSVLSFSPPQLPHAPLPQSPFGFPLGIMEQPQQVQRTQKPEQSTSHNQHQQAQLLNQYPQPSPQAENFRHRHNVEYNESNVRGGSTSAGPIADTPASSSTVPASSSPGDYMTFYDSLEPVVVRAGRLVASGPLSLASIVKKDPFLRVTLLKMRKEKNSFTHPFKSKTVDSKELIKQIILDKESKTSSNPKVEEAFKKRLLQNEALDEVKGASTERRDTQIFGATRVDYETETIMKIEEALPNQQVIWALYDIFMKGPLFAFMPFINEMFLSEKIQEIIGKRTDKPVKVQRLVITRRFDFAYIGILLIILRLTYLTMSKTSNNTEFEKYMFEHPIGLNIINVAQMCLNQFRLLRRGAVPLLQCSLFMRYYHKLAPEDGDGSDGGDSEVFLGMLLQMGNSIGLNRDLSKVRYLNTNQRLSNVWRFIWHEIVSLDLYLSFTRGNPILIDEDAFDTMLPEWCSDYALMANPEVYKAAIKNFEMSDVINNLVRDILKDVLNIKKPVQIHNFTTKLSKLEALMDGDQFHSIDSILNLPCIGVGENVDKIYKMKNYIEVKTSLYAVYFHIYLHDPLNNYEILYKMLEIAMELIPLSYFLTTINNGKTSYFDAIFGNGSQLILVPTMLSSLHKISQVLVSFISRTLDVKYNYADNERVPAIMLIQQGFKESFVLVRDSFHSLSSVYYHAWKAFKSFDFLDKLLSSEDDCIWDKMSAMNAECKNGDIDPDINHFAHMPTENDLVVMTPFQLEKLRVLVTTKKFEEPVLRRLDTRSKKSTVAGPMISFGEGGENVLNPDPSHSLPMNATASDRMSSDQSTPPLNGFHVNKNVMSSLEVDRQWFHMMAQNTNTNLNFNEQNQGHFINGHLNNNGVNNNSNVNALDGSAAGGDDSVNVDTLDVGVGVGVGVGGGGLGIGSHMGLNLQGNQWNGSNNMFEPSNNFGGVFGSLDLEKFVGDSSPYDLFDIPAFYQDS